MKLRKWTAEEKMAIVLEGLRAQRSVAQIYREHQVSQTIFYRWRDRFLEGGQKALTNGARDEVTVLRVEAEKLQKIIGRQTIAIEALKKRRVSFEASRGDDGGQRGEREVILRDSWGESQRLVSEGRVGEAVHRVR